MTHYVSYFELRLNNGELSGHLGSGKAEEIVDRYHTDPSIRICIQEPANVECRLRFGIAKLTETSLEPVKYDDEMEHRGAWARSVPMAVAALKRLSEAWQGDHISHLVIGEGLKTGWIKVEDSALEAVTLASARSGLVDSILAGAEDRLFIRFGGTYKQLSEALSRVGEDIAKNPESFL